MAADAQRLGCAGMATFIQRLETTGAGDRLAVKDLIDMAGLPTTAGCRAVADVALPEAEDAACMAGARAAERDGRVRIVGKANLHELAFGASGINSGFGTPVNPRTLASYRAGLPAARPWPWPATRPTSPSAATPEDRCGSPRRAAGQRGSRRPTDGCPSMGSGRWRPVSTPSGPWPGTWPAW